MPILFAPRLALCAVEGCLFALGGFNDGVELACCERYSPQFDRWELLRPLGARRTQLAACAYGRQVYAAGGFAQDGDVARVERFDGDSWQAVQDLPVPRRGAALVAVARRDKGA